MRCKKRNIRKSNSCWMSVIEGDLKATFSIDTTGRCRGESYSFLMNAPLNA